MKIDEFEQQHTDASNGCVKGDGQAANNAETVEALVDAFLGLPCGQAEVVKARQMRIEWRRMKAQGDWTQWPTRDLERLMAVLMVMHSMTDETAQSLAIFLLARRIQEL